MLFKLGHLVFAAATLAVAPAAAQVAALDTPEATTASLQAKAAQFGRARVIVELNASIGVAVPEAGASQDAALAAGIRSAGSAVAASALGAENDASYMTYSPMFAASATAEQIAKLAGDPRVKRVLEDKLDAPNLLQSLPLVKASGAGNAHAIGARGAGRVVAILDSGVDKNHEFLRGKVKSEACYSSNEPSFGATSLCPGGAASSTAANSGLDCNPSIDGCGHGTHVAGIAAGKNSSRSSGEPVSGVARDASVIAIQVFSRFPAGGADCGFFSTRPCILAFQSDQIKALERVYALRGGLAGGRKIDAVNMSLGGGRTTGFCNTDLRKPIIDLLRRASIATVISSGNGGFVDSVGFPACIQTATTVGASTKNTAGNPERMASYTNQGPQVDMLAPGGDFGYPFPSSNPANPIQSSYLGAAYAYLAGTSMAAPHVAGAFAAIRSVPACATKTVAQIEAALGRTGPLITDHRVVSGSPQLKERRIDVMAALAYLGCL